MKASNTGAQSARNEKGPKVRELEVKLEAARSAHAKQKKELEASVSALQAELRTAKNLKAKESKGKETELKDLKTERDSLNANIKKLETTLKEQDAKHKKQVGELNERLVASSKEV